uniref:Uncharacterized protein n=1 Tax=Leersia perrieri TaxID=77586 RepID=A0A0D9VK46_9ORYZ
MGCYHLGKFVSKVLGKCNGQESGWREERLDYAMAYPPGPPTETYFMRPAARTVTFSAANSVYAATPRRHEYFSGEYRYSYPTPVREGIYRMATDANRLTTIFSEENPNACAIM